MVSDQIEVVAAEACRLGRKAQAFLRGVQLLIGLSQGRFGLLALGDVNQGEHHPGDTIFGGAVRQQPRQVPAAVGAGRLALERRELVKDALGIGWRRNRIRADGAGRTTAIRGRSGSG